jgi:DNA modification methylase
MASEKNKLYYGDNLDVLKMYIKDESVDLVYLDPPFNSRQDYNVLFAEKDGSQSSSQIHAFEDTWEWNIEAERTLEEIIEKGGRVADALRSFRTFLGGSDMMAYLAMMAPRLVELRRVMKETGSIYLHCDPTASHYLKILMDAVFGPQNLLNELIWKSTHSHGGASRYGRVHDVVLFYSKSPAYTWNAQKIAYSEEYQKKFFRFQDADGRTYRSTILTGSGIRTGSSGKPWRGINPTKVGRHWAIPGYIRPLLPRPDVKKVQDALDQLDEIGRILWPQKKGGTPSFKQYLDDLGGVDVQDVVTDIPPIAAQAQERLGYQTQKPEALLERFIKASSNEGDLVLDPFCGCGTTVQVAQNLNRRWIGIDITHLAINQIKNRLSTAFEDRNPPIETTYEVIGEPTDLAGAQTLASQKDKYQFSHGRLAWLGRGLLKQSRRELTVASTAASFSMMTNPANPSKSYFLSKQAELLSLRFVTW